MPRHSTVRKAINGYNVQSGRVADTTDKYEIYAVAGGTGVSLVIKWLKKGSQI